MLKLNKISHLNRASLSQILSKIAEVKFMRLGQEKDSDKVNYGSFATVGLKLLDPDLDVSNVQIGYTFKGANRLLDLGSPL